jgi:hypothetical protein
MSVNKSKTGKTGGIKPHWSTVPHKEIQPSVIIFILWAKYNIKKYKYIRYIKITKYSKNIKHFYLKYCDINEESAVTKLRHSKLLLRVTIIAHATEEHVTSSVTSRSNRRDVGSGVLCGTAPRLHHSTDRPRQTDWLTVSRNVTLNLVSGVELSWESTVVGQSPAVSTEAEDIVGSR